MSHNITKSADGTRDLFASYREPAWHRLGNVFEEPVTEYQEMLVAAGLSDWNVRKEALITESGLVVPSNFATVRTEMSDQGVATVPMGVVGDRYEPVQNEDAFSVLQSLADGATWETAGAIGNGALVFGSLAFERETVLDPNGVSDVVKHYALCVNGHDGKTPFTFRSTPVRVVCQNTLNVAMGQCSNVVKVRHTATATDRAKVAAELWRQENAYMDAFDREAKALFEKKVTDRQFSALLDRMMPMPKDTTKGAATRQENRRGLVTQAWKGEPNAGIRGTAWGAWNALTEANQWGREVRGQGDGFALAGAGFDGPTNKFRAEALAAVKRLG